VAILLRDGQYLNGVANFLDRVAWVARVAKVPGVAKVSGVARNLFYLICILQQICFQ